MSIGAVLERLTFETSRVAEYFNAQELQAQTGQAREHFATVALKELVDNALDAAETAGVQPEISIEATCTSDRLTLTVTDNGTGIQSETVQRILNFQTRTSDKAAYRAPTRGLQGNALKTILGLPYALGCKDSVIIEAHGIRHVICAWIDPAGELRIDHHPEQRPTRAGTLISLTLPRAGQECSPISWARAFALFNPQAVIKIRDLSDSSDNSKHAYSTEAKSWNSYQATVSFPSQWRKFLPTDLTSPWWYDADTLGRLVFSHIAHARRGGKDLTLREFVRQFRGLSGTAKAKSVCDRFPEIARLSDFGHVPEQERTTLLDVMQQETTPPSPSVLGFIGEEHFRARFDAWYSVKRFWYRKVTGDIDGIPFVFEAALAETRTPGDLFTGINFSPTFEDPFANTVLPGAEWTAYGVQGFLTRGHAVSAFPSRETPTKTAAAVHLTCPVLDFLDRGKTRLKVPMAMAEQFAKALWAVVRELYQEEERRRKDAARAERRQETRERERQPSQCSLTEAVFASIPQAYESATGGGVYDVSARDFFYEVRPLIQHLTDKELDFNYFSQHLLTEYRQQYKPLPKLYYKPRGVLYEPHSGEEIQLGTREANGYEFPAWLYDKILYIEKDGVWQGLRVSKLAERFDMAVIAAEGYATEAIRLLLARADQNRRYRIFVFHDADPYGYNIARTLREETRRMSGYQVEVVDLGLRLEDALAMGLQTEKFTRKKALPAGLKLNELERRYFEGRQAGKKAWVCERIEINAMPVPDRAPYLERKLREAGAGDKVVPPKNMLPKLVEELYEQQMARWIDDTLSRFLSIETIKQSLTDLFKSRIPFGEAGQWITETFAMDETYSWRSAVRDKLWTLLRKYGPDLDTALRGKVVQAMQALETP